MTNSSPRSAFYSDGYRARLNGEQCSPPDVPVYAAEYRQGYYDAAFSPQARRKYSRANTVNFGNLAKRGKSYWGDQP